MSKKKKAVKVEKINPRSDYVFVEVDEVKEITSGGIVLPQSARQAETDEVKVRFGVVMAVGPGLRLDDGTIAAPLLSVGDRVVVDVDSGEEVKHGGKQYVAIREQNVLAVVE